MKPTLALSTSWCSHRFKDGYEMLQEMAGLGFEYAELSHGIRITLVPGILKGLEEGIIKVGSTHNFCPLPPGVMHAAPNHYEPSASDSRERDQWVRQTKKSIDFASVIGSKVLVCHLGSVRFFWFHPVRPVERYQQEEPEADRTDPEFRAVVDRALAKVNRRKARFWQNTKTSVLQALDYASDKGITLGFENRERIEELPIDSDFPEFLSSLPAGSPCGYWHDVGHGDIKERLGLIDHRGQLEANSSRQVGFHLHDVNSKGHDHQGVGTGHIDFDMISSFWRPHHRLVLELGPSVPKEDVVASKARIDALISRVA